MAGNVTRRRLLGLGALGLVGLGLSSPCLDDMLGVDVPLIREAQAAEEAPMNAQVLRYIESQRNKKWATGERYSFYVLDANTNEVLLDINGDVPMQAASMIKPHVALAYAYAAGMGRVEWSNEAKIHIKASLIHSNNYSTNWLIDRLGGPARIQQRLLEGFSFIYKPTRTSNVSLTIVEKIPVPSGRTYRNMVSARDNARLFYAIWNEDSRIPHVQELKEWMSEPNRNRIVDYSSNIPTEDQGTVVMDKTGSTSESINNGGAAEVKGSDGRKYTFFVVGMFDREGLGRHSNYVVFKANRGHMIGHVTGMAYNQMRRIHPAMPTR